MDTSKLALFFDCLMPDVVLSQEEVREGRRSVK